jgi:hypothetical protein
VNLLRRLVPALVLSLTAGTPESPALAAPAAGRGPSAEQAAAAGGDAARCPLRGTDLDPLTPHRWELAQYRANQPFAWDGTIRIDMCELVGRDAKGQMRTGVMVHIATGAQAEAFARHWHAVCAGSIVPDARGTVQPVPGVPGGQRCVTASGSASFHWLESPGRTVQIEPLTDDVPWASILPKLVAAAAR